jgi:hypothetical protein
MIDRNRRTIPRRQIKVQKKTRSTRSKAHDAQWERVNDQLATPSGKPFLPVTRLSIIQIVRHSQRLGAGSFPGIAGTSDQENADFL